MHIIGRINFILMVLFFLCYVYQFYYVYVSLRRRPPAHRGTPGRHHIAVLIAARNESAVIGNLIDSIQAQDYPKELVDIFVVADNCTDDTAALCRGMGARVFERHDTNQVGKGHALNFLLQQIAREPDAEVFDGYLVLDADNVLAENYITEMNKTFSDGYEVLTSYRNSKNYGDNWISAGYALWFLREARYLNQSRMILGNSCAVSGTGFLFSKRVLARCGGGWNFFLLTEDIQFTIDNVVRGEKIGYCAGAVLYDEQPTTFAQSWRQRMRWAKGYLQVFRCYGGKLFRGIFRGDFSCFDMAMSIMPATILTGASMVATAIAVVAMAGSGRSLIEAAPALLLPLLNLYLTVFVVGAITTGTEWKQIHCRKGKKLLYMFTFPIFMLTYIPIGIIALFKRVEWQPIRHDRCLKLDQIRGGAAQTASQRERVLSHRAS